MRENWFPTRFLHNYYSFVQVFSWFLGHFSFLRERQKRKSQRQIFFGRWLFWANHGFLSPNRAYTLENQRLAKTSQNSEIFGQIFFCGKRASFEGLRLFWEAFRIDNYYYYMAFQTLGGASLCFTRCAICLMPQDYSKAATHTKTYRTPFFKKSRSKLSCLAIVAKKGLRYMKKAVTTTSTAANSCHFFNAQKLKTT